MGNLFVYIWNNEANSNDFAVREVHHMSSLLLKKLHDLEIVESPFVLPCNLATPLMELMDRSDGWTPSTIASRPDGRRYDVNTDDQLWEALLPCLRLLTRFLTNAQLTDWYVLFAYFDNKSWKSY